MSGTLPDTGPVARSGDGFVVDAALLADLFGIAPAAVRKGMRDSTITSRCETGVDEDAGRWRLTFQHDGRACRLVVDGDGTILRRATFPIRGPAPREDGPAPAPPDEGAAGLRRGTPEDDG